MHKALARSLTLGLVMLCFGQGTASAQVNEPLKPYILFIADVSRSMELATRSGSPSCAIGDTRMNHLKCALANIVNGYGEMVLALGRFRQTSRDTCSEADPDDICVMRSLNCDPCIANPADCTPAMASGDRFELLVPLVEGNQADLLRWVDFSCGTCSSPRPGDPEYPGNPELSIQGWTPIAGALKGAKLYFQGQSTPGVDTAVGVQPYWTGPGADPIRNDPLRNVFIGSEQCRPYTVIMLTDGEETCASSYNETLEAAQALLTTEVDGRTYRIRTRPIGFGRRPGNRAIEELAWAGGAVDVPGVNEAYYAQNEAELSLAISQIVSESLKYETCNDLDDDCDIAIDEDFPAKNSECNDGQFGICRSRGIYQCSQSGGLECVITTPGQPATMETCNGLDDDCDAKVDEGSVCAGCGTVEFCDNQDNDCDGRVDESITRPCGTDVGECTGGTETCVNGSWQGCTAVGGSAELCDGLDNNCDGTPDGFAEVCVTIPGNNPGVGLCQPGVQVCPSDGSGSFGPCLGEIGPTVETCDLLDQDCDGRVDEGTGGGSCNGTCGEGIIECIDGTLQCTSQFDPAPERCDGLDNDCDALIDEALPANGSCGTTDEGACRLGELRCISGTYQCVGSVGSAPEACDCQDNDCDGQTDEEPPALCPSGSQCVDCQCAQPCQAGEFPCPTGFTCSPERFCVADPCAGIECEPDANGDQTECVNGTCVRSCDLVTCPAGQVCLGSTGSCAPDTCTTFPDRCAEGERCVDGECVSDPCTGVTCEENQYCYGGNCVTSCASVTCPDGQRCVLGQCEPDPCGRPCPGGQVCNEASGLCQESLCNTGVRCPVGLACNPQNGRCEDDPCAGVTCPGSGQVCVSGTCDLPSAAPGVDIDYVSPGGGGCSAGGGASGGLVLLVMAVALGLATRRERDHA